MLLQGDLQRVFDALYRMGVLDPVLKMDWSTELRKIQSNPCGLAKIVQVVNSSKGDCQELIDELSCYSEKDLSHLAMVVAEELVGFHENKELH